MPNAVVTGLISEFTKNGCFYQSGRKYKILGGCRTSIRIPNEPLPVAPRHFFCTKFRANIRRADGVGPIYSHIWRPKSNLDWNLVIMLRSRDICTFTAQKSKCTRNFWEIRHWYFAHMLNVQLPALRPVTMETQCFPKKLEFQRYPPKDFCTARYEHKSLRKKFQTFRKTRKKSFLGRSWTKIGPRKTQQNVCLTRRDSESWTDIDRQNQWLRHEIWTGCAR